MFEFLVLLAPLLTPQFGQQTLLDPKDYTSPDGVYVLHVDPSTRDGAGSAHYTMRSGSRVVWDAEMEFTFRVAEVTDTGYSIGYAFTEDVDRTRFAGTSRTGIRTVKFETAPRIETVRAGEIPPWRS